MSFEDALKVAAAKPAGKRPYFLDAVRWSGSWPSPWRRCRSWRWPASAIDTLERLLEAKGVVSARGDRRLCTPNTEPGGGAGPVDPGIPRSASSASSSRRARPSPPPPAATSAPKRWRWKSPPTRTALRRPHRPPSDPPIADGEVAAKPTEGPRASAEAASLRLPSGCAGRPPPGLRPYSPIKWGRSARTWVHVPKGVARAAASRLDCRAASLDTPCAF